MFNLLTSDPLAFAILAVIFVFSLIIHEYAHGWVADRLGDPTARLAGRLTFNPLAHLDPIGTFLLVFAGFGWAKPVPVDVRNLANPVTDEIQVALAGPFANLTLAIVIGLLLRIVTPTIGDASILSQTLTAFGQLIIQLNLSLMIFNLLPIPPLDGSRLLQLFIPIDVYAMIEQVGILLLLGLFLFGGGIIGQILQLTVQPLMQLILG